MPNKLHITVKVFSQHAAFLFFDVHPP